MIKAFIADYWELVIMGLLLLNTIIQKLEKIKGNSDILTWIWQFLTWIKSTFMVLVKAVFSTIPGKLPMLFLVFLLSSFLVMGMGITSEIATFQWDAPTDSDLAGYRIYQSNQSGVYTYGPTSLNLIATIPLGTEEIALEIDDGTYFWVATAFDTGGQESEPSNEITDTIDGPPGCPKIFRFKSSS